MIRLMNTYARVTLLVTLAASATFVAATPADDAPTLRSLTSTRSWDVITADWNGDGRDDVFLVQHDGTDTHDRWWIGQEDGSFIGDSVLFPHADRHGCDTGDVNGDGTLDMLCMVGADRGQGDGGNELWIQTENGGVENVAEEWGIVDPFGRGRRPLVADFNGDGLDDAYLTNWSVDRDDGERNENMLMLSDGSKMTEVVTSLTGKRGSICVAEGDWNGDGRPDVAVCGSSLELHLNRGGGRFQDVTHLLGSSTIPWPRDAKFSDVDGDGHDDLIVITRSDVEVRLNRAPAGVKYSEISRSWSHDAAKEVEIASNDLYVLQGEHNGRNWPDLLIVDAKTKTGISFTKKGIGGHAAALSNGWVVVHGDEQVDGPVSIVLR